MAKIAWAVLGLVFLADRGSHSNSGAPRAYAPQLNGTITQISNIGHGIEIF